MVTWGKFRDKRSGKVFFLFNTHFDHMGKIARQKSADLLTQKVNEIASAVPAVISGDFNSEPDSIAYQSITASLDDSRPQSATPPRGPEGTSRDFDLDSVPQKRIDYIFVNQGVSVQEFAVLDDTYGKGRRPSDHMPVLAVVAIPD